MLLTGRTGCSKFTQYERSYRREISHSFSFVNIYEAIGPYKYPSIKCEDYPIYQIN